MSRLRREKDELDFPTQVACPFCSTHDRCTTLGVMQATDEMLRELEGLLREDYPHETFTREQLLEIANRLIRAAQLVYRPIPPGQTDTTLPNERD